MSGEIWRCFAFAIATGEATIPDIVISKPWSLPNEPENTQETVGRTQDRD